MRKMSGIHSLFGLWSPSAAGIRVGSYPPARPIPELVPMECSPQPHRVEMSRMKNGVRILTESAEMPSEVTIAVCVGTGPRDEDLAHSGITQALKHTYLKTNTRTNEQLNYCIVQMSGGEFSMSFDQEAMLYSGHCLAHDVYDFLQMTADIVLDDKTIMDEEAAHWRADEYFKLRELTKTHASVIEDSWLTTAYGLKNLGMPLAGLHSKFQDIGYSHINHFREHFATPDRMIVMGAGIKNHDEFAAAVLPYFAHLEAKSPSPRQPPTYLGGEMRTCTEDLHTTIHISFLGPPAGADSIFPLIILRTLLGESSATAPPSTCRAYSHFRQKYPFITSAGFSYAGFTDSSNLGFNVSGPSSSAGKLADALSTELQDLTKVSEEEVQRAKLRFQAWVSNNFNSPKYRLYKYSMGMRYEGVPRTLPEIFAKSSAVTAQDVRSTAERLMRTVPTLIVQGNTHAVPSADTFYARLK